MSDDFPTYRGEMEYYCLGCGRRYPSDSLLYTCPECGDVLLLENKKFDELKNHDGQYWRFPRFYPQERSARRVPLL